tara:strand:+ start:166 stop:645 length:480 start_codon:yes stop_codon:yes gene_type:complete
LAKVFFKATKIFKHYALEEDGNEPGAQEHRFDTKLIDPSKGTASGYIAKYISKGIDGHGIDADLYGKDAKTSAPSVKAWASTWNIRQFQSIGMPSVTVWRELRRISADSSLNLCSRYCCHGCCCFSLLQERQQGTTFPHAWRPRDFLFIGIRWSWESDP